MHLHVCSVQCSGLAVRQSNEIFQSSLISFLALYSLSSPYVLRLVSCSHFCTLHFSDIGFDMPLKGS